MKLILTQEVTGLGAPGDVVEVKDGYGRNYLVPRGVGDPLDPRRREDRRVDQDAPAPRARSATTTTPSRSRPSSRPPRSTSRSAPARAVACSAPSPPPRSPTPSPRPPASRSTGARSWSSNPIKSLGCPRGGRQAARRGVRHGGPQRRPRLTHPHAPRGPFLLREGRPSWRRWGLRHRRSSTGSGTGPPGPRAGPRRRRAARSAARHGPGGEVRRHLEARLARPEDQHREQADHDQRRAGGRAASAPAGVGRGQGPPGRARGRAAPRRRSAAGWPPRRARRRRRTARP